MKVLLVNAGEDIIALSCEPIGLEYLASYLEQYGVEVKICNMIQHNIKKIIKSWKPNLVGVSATTPVVNSAYRLLDYCRSIGVPTVIGGVHASTMPEEAIKHADWVVVGDGEEALMQIINSFYSYEIMHSFSGKNEICKPIFILPHGILRPEYIKDISKLPPPARHLVDIDYFYTASGHGWPFGEHKKTATILTSRGCPFRCLAGDTIVYTINGKFKIKDLVGREGVKVLSRNPATQEPVYVSAINIQKTQEMAKLVRVHFDDGTHIDCTPDHKFKVFKAKNQFIDESEWDEEAQNLKPKQQIRAVRFDANKSGRICISTRRNITKLHAQIVMAGFINRSLSRDERIHHKDRNPGNDNIENLILTTTKDHVGLHPEISERMKLNNPAKNMTEKWKKNISINGKGKKRSLEQRMRYRESKLGIKNPHYNPNKKYPRTYPSRIPEVNHKVLWVEPLSHHEDVYCMEVPGINWFYANNVLVHNCSFCRNSKAFCPPRYNSVENVLQEIADIKNAYKVDKFYFLDDDLLLPPARFKQIAKGISGWNIRWGMAARSSSITREGAAYAKMAGCEYIFMGFESNSQKCLDALGKRTTPADNQRAVDICNEFGIKVVAGFMVGIPGETPDDLEETIKFIKGNKFFSIGLCMATPMPGTLMWDQAEQNGLLPAERDWDNFTIGNPKLRCTPNPAMTFDETMKYFNIIDNLCEKKRATIEMGWIWSMFRKYPMAAIKTIWQYRKRLLRYIGRVR